MKNRCALLIAVGVAVAATNALGSAEELAGTWKRATSNLTVNVKSWGENCGPAPKSFSNNSVVEVEIVAQGRHLVFTKGGLRTDRCSSANPKLVTKSESVADAQWQRVCETPPDDSKFEHDEYVFSALGKYRIEYHAKSSYDWTLNGDHCVLALEERRVFVRSPDDAERDAANGAAAPSAAEPEAEQPAERACERQGEVRRLQVVPREADVGPGERLCFKAIGVDAAGCRFPAEAAWTAEQNGVAVPRLMARGGCFQAGATAAESEGRYAIVAQFEGKKADAAVTVVFPDYGSLARVRLDPSREVDAGSPAARSPAPSGAAAQGLAPSAAAPPRRSGLIVAVIAGVALLAAAALGIALWLRRRAAAGRTDDEDPYAGEERGGAADGTVRCAKCGGTFPSGARFCPNDGAVLTPGPGAGPSGDPVDDSVGMVCPTCHRGYSAEARFCPHDSARLLPYAEWRSRRRGPR